MTENKDSNKVTSLSQHREYKKIKESESFGFLADLLKNHKDKILDIKTEN